MNLKEITESVEKRRKELTLSQTQLAEAAGISRIQYLNIINGHTPNPGFQTITEIISALDRLGAEQGKDKASPPNESAA